MQQSNEKQVSSQNLKLWFCVECFEKKTLNLSNLKPHIFFILGPFWMT
jgi:hypothetical protein